MQDDGSIEIKDESVDAILNGIEALGISTEDLKLLGDYEESATEEEKLAAQKKYVKKFFEAQVVTETLYYNNGEIPGKTYGTVYVYRQNDDGTKTQLKYIPYEEMKSYEQKTDQKSTEESRNYFSYNPDTDTLVYTGTTDIVVEKGSDLSNLKVDNQSSSSSAHMYSIDYKSAISQYTTKMNFLVYLTMVSQNPEFVAAVTDLIKDSRIELTIVDNITTNVSIEKYTYTVNTRIEYSYTDENGVSNTGYETTNSDKTEYTKTTITSTTPTLKITKAKTWFSNQDIVYERKRVPGETVSYENNSSNDPTLQDEPALTGTQTGTWITDKVKQYDNNTTTSEIIEVSRSDVDFSVLGEFGDSKEGKNTFIALMETKYRIPYSTRYEAAGGNLVSGADLLFMLLQQDSSLEGMEEVMRRALAIYTGDSKKYGVSDLDGSLFEIGDFISITGGIYGSNAEEKVWFSLKAAGYSDIATAAVMGNIANESGFDPAKIEGGTGIGLGLCQWSFGRRTALEAYIASKGTTTSDINTQIEFLLAELTPGGGAGGFASYQMGSASSSKYDGKRYTANDWKNADNIETATTAFMAVFERPSYDPSENHLDRRINDAKAYLEAYQGREAPTSDARIGEILLTGDNYTKMANMLAEAIRICDDDRYTYSQANRYGEFQYDCSSLVYRLYQKFFGVQTPLATSGYSITSPYWVGPVGSVTLQPGDVLWRSGHVEIYLGNGLTAAAKSGKVAIPDQVKVSEVNLSSFTYVYRFIK